ncbi:DUF1465 family protein [Ancylobacter dichloromethanicus]|uniref:AraC family transcriptional regulator n=1 Tax=Ancylobacter dichloromethanicus TaxID=518825 RepID=A0A9W6MY18_9HYPH|nr:DUF1465 family protein [Ancylobacter dichloromethanicus]MBS7555300.1 DUF1465 family protein [Ancylobacter dichloromethanicus]GLK70482.1 AraC family transcriptional regulator [Ancylobacter dichloromethanicus]
MGSIREDSDENGTSEQAGPAPGAEMIRFAERRLASPAFLVLFADGMQLVDDTAAYLDGEGREASRALPRGAAAAYVQQSMRHSTRLMQLASWLLLCRAVAEGEMSRETAARESARIDLKGAPRDVDQEALLPPPLARLVLRGFELQRQIVRLESALAGPSPVENAGLRPNAVAGQIGRLRRAFEHR